MDERLVVKIKGHYYVSASYYYKKKDVSLNILPRAVTSKKGCKCNLICVM